MDRRSFILMERQRKRPGRRRRRPTGARRLRERRPKASHRRLAGSGLTDYGGRVAFSRPDAPPRGGANGVQVQARSLRRKGPQDGPERARAPRGTFPPQCSAEVHPARSQGRDELHAGPLVLWRVYVSAGPKIPDKRGCSALVSMRGRACRSNSPQPAPEQAPPRETSLTEPIAIEAAWCSLTDQGTSVVNIGKLTKQQDGSYKGEIATLTVRSRVTMRPVEDKTERGPDFRLFAGYGECGAAFGKTARNTDTEYLFIKLDDPTFAAPVLAKGFYDREDADTINLVWDREREQPQG
jgi:uncharacterized protein (DUF736 family)